MGDFEGVIISSGDYPRMWRHLAGKPFSERGFFAF